MYFFPFLAQWNSFLKLGNVEKSRLFSVAKEEEREAKCVTHRRKKKLFVSKRNRFSSWISSHRFSFFLFLRPSCHFHPKVKRSPFLSTMSCANSGIVKIKFNGKTYGFRVSFEDQQKLLKGNCLKFSMSMDVMQCNFIACVFPQTTSFCSNILQ